MSVTKGGRGDITQRRVATFFDKHPLVFAALGTLIGVVYGQRLPFAPLWMAALLGASILFFCVIIRRGRAPGLGVVLLFAGVFMLYTNIVAHPRTIKEGTYLIEGVIDDNVRVDDDGRVRTYLSDVKVLAGECAGYTFNAYWSFYLEEGESVLLHPGQRVQLEAWLYVPGGQVNPYGYDFRATLMRRGVTMGVYGKEGLLLGALEPSLGIHALYAREAIMARMDALFLDHSMLPKALVLGEKEDMPREMRDAFSNAGVAHTLAVSGLHVGLLAGALCLLLKRLVSFRVRAGIVLVFLMAYCVLLGFSPSVVRASVMMTVTLFSRARGRRPDPLSVLSLGFILVLALQPLDLFSYGFVLSFSAVLGIMLLYKACYALYGFLHFRRARMGMACTTAAVSGTLLPVSLTFHSLSLMGLVISPALCALMAVLLPYVVVVVMVSVVHAPFAALLAQPGAAVFALMEGVLSALGGMDYAAVRIPDIPLAFFPFFIALFLLLSPYTKMGRRRAAALLAALFVLGCGVHLATMDNGLSYTQLSVGEADSAVVFDGRETVVIDTGENAGDLVNYLLAKGRRVDALVISHMHLDHVGGTLQLLNAKIPISHIYLPHGALMGSISQEALALYERLVQTGTPITYLSAGDCVKLSQKTTMTVLWPYLDTVRRGADLNDRALVAMLDLDGFSLLTTSDISAPYDLYAAQKAQGLKVSHHGGANNTSDAFLSIVRPALALVSSDVIKSDAPRQATLKKLQFIGAQTLVTGQAGAIRLEIGQGAVRVIPFLSMKEEQ